MPYYVMLTPDIRGIFGAGTNKPNIITSLRSGGISARAYDVRTGAELTKNLDNFKQLDLLPLGADKVTFDGSKLALVLGTDKDSRLQLRADLSDYFAQSGWQVDEIALRVPRYNEWLACVTFVEPDGANVEPTFQVVACVGASAVKDSPCSWAQEERPGQLWTTHIGAGPKMIRDVASFTGRGRW